MDIENEYFHVIEIQSEIISESRGNDEIVVNSLNNESLRMKFKYT